MSIFTLQKVPNLQSKPFLRVGKVVGRFSALKVLKIKLLTDERRPCFCVVCLASEVCYGVVVELYRMLCWACRGQSRFVVKQLLGYNATCQLMYAICAIADDCCLRP